MKTKLETMVDRAYAYAEEAERNYQELCAGEYTAEQEAEACEHARACWEAAEELAVQLSNA